MTQDLERHYPPARDIPRPPHLAAAALADELLDPVASDLRRRAPRRTRAVHHRHLLAAKATTHRGHPAEVVHRAGFPPQGSRYGGPRRRRGTPWQRATGTSWRPAAASGWDRTTAGRWDR